MAGLTGKQLAFVNAYLGNAKFNATEAARIAGYKGNDVTIRNVAKENLTKPYIKKAIADYWNTNAMPAEEVLSRLAEMARSDYGDFVELSNGRLLVKDTAQLKGKTHLIKKIKETKDGIEVELHDPKAALDSIGKYHALFTDVTVKVERELEDALDRLQTNLSPDDYAKVIEALKK